MTTSQDSENKSEKSNSSNENGTSTSKSKDEDKETQKDEGEDLTMDKKGGVIRYIIVPGLEEEEEPVAGFSKDPEPRSKGPETPKRTAIDSTPISISLEGYYNDTLFEKREVDFPLGEGRSKKYKIPRGVELALYKFKEGEKSRLELKSDFAFGQKGNEELGIPPDAPVTYIVELKKVDRPKDWWLLVGTERLPVALEAKEKGTAYYKAEEYDLAVDQYDLVLRYIVNEDRTKDKDEEERQAMILASFLNKSLCHLKMREYDKAKDSAEKALMLKPGNIKGLYRLGLAKIGLGEPTEAKEKFQQVLKEDPQNRDAAFKIGECNKLIVEEKKRQKEMCRNMFFGEPSNTNTDTADDDDN